MDVISSVEVRTQDSAKLISDQFFDHFPRTAVMVFIIAKRGSRDAPDVAIASIFAPSCFIGLHRWAGTDLRFEPIEHWLGMLSDTVEHFHQFPQADLESVEAQQIGLNLSKGQAHHGAQAGDEAGNPDTQPSLSQHL